MDIICQENYLILNSNVSCNEKIIDDSAYLSMHIPTAVNNKCLAGHKITVITGKKKDSTHQVLGFLQPPQGRQARIVCVDVVGNGSTGG